MSAPFVRSRSALGLLLLLASLPVSAVMEGQDHDSALISDQFGISYGFLAVDFNTTAQIGIGGIIGSFVRLESQLDLDEDLEVGWVNGFWQFNRRHAIDFGFGRLDRSGSSVLDETIEFDDIIYEVGGQVDSVFEMALFRTLYRYSFFNDGKAAGGITAGLNTFLFDLAIVGDGTIVGDDTTVIEDARAEADIIAPVPSVGFFMQYAFNPRTIARFRTSWLDLSVDDFEGKLLDMSFTVDWFFARHFGLGGGVVSTDLNFSRTGKDPFRVDYRYSGLMLQLTVSLP